MYLGNSFLYSVSSVLNAEKEDYVTAASFLLPQFHFLSINVFTMRFDSENKPGGRMLRSRKAVKSRQNGDLCG